MLQNVAGRRGVTVSSVRHKMSTVRRTDVSSGRSIDRPKEGMQQGAERCMQLIGNGNATCCTVQYTDIERRDSNAFYCKLNWYMEIEHFSSYIPHAWNRTIISEIPV